MTEMVEVLKMKTLLHFLDCNPSECGGAKIARALKTEKYVISRAMQRLEKEGLLIRNGRTPRLTEEGEKKAQWYAERINVLMNHYTYGGVDIESARQDAVFGALNMSEGSMDVFRAESERYRVKRELRKQAHFNGAMLCEMMKDGYYQFPFLIYREQIKDGNNLSMANAGFEHPCILHVSNGKGKFLLQIKEMSAQSAINAKVMSGSVRNLQYLIDSHYVKAEYSGNIITIPAESLNFVNIGHGIGQILHGSVCLKMECSVGVSHMPTATAIFTVMI